MPYKKHFKYFPYMSKSCPLRFVSQSGPTDLRHFDPEFTHLPVSSSLCTDAPTVTSSVKEAAGAFPGFSYGPPADHSFMWTSTLLTRLSEELTRTRTKSLDFRVLFLDWGDHAGAACTGRGGRYTPWWEDLTDRMDMKTFGGSCAWKVYRWVLSRYNTARPYSSASTAPKLKKEIHVCQVWKHSEVIKHRSPRTRDLAATGEVTWREVPEVQKAVWKRQQQRHQKNLKSISLVRALRPEHSLLGGDAFSYTSTYVQTVSVVFM